MRGSAAKIVVSGARGAYDGAKIKKGQIGSTPEGGGALMPHYITLFRFTQKGIENIKKVPLVSTQARKQSRLPAAS
jgi:hypothetical protein